MRLLTDEVVDHEGCFDRLPNGILSVEVGNLSARCVTAGDGEGTAGFDWSEPTRDHRDRQGLFGGIPEPVTRVAEKVVEGVVYPNAISCTLSLSHCLDRAGSSPAART